MDKTKALLDRLPAAVRHAVLVFVGALLAWASTAVLNIQIDNNAVLTGVVTSAGTSAAATAVLWFTKLTKQYGLGADGKPLDETVDPTA